MTASRHRPSWIDEPPVALRGLTFLFAVTFLLTGCASKPAAPIPTSSTTATSKTILNESTKAPRSGAEVSDLSNQASAGTFGEPTFKTEPWRFGDAQGLLISTPHYRVFTTVTQPSFVDRLPGFYENVLELYTSALADLPKPDELLTSYLFYNRRQWMAKTQEILPEQADMFSNLGRGGFTTRGTSVLYYIDRWGPPRDTFAIAAHEGWHQYTQQTFRHQLPIWLEEGIATYMEGYRITRQGDFQWQPWANFERWETLDEAVRGNDLIDLSELLTRTPQSFLNDSKDSLLVYYAQVWALTRFLAEGEDGRYRSDLEQVLLDTANGKLIGRMMASSSNRGGGSRRGVGMINRVGPAVVREYFNADLVEFESQYLRFVNEIIAQRPTSRGPGR